MLANIQTFVDIAKSVKDTDFVIEAVFDIMDLKRQTFPALGATAPKEHHIGFEYSQYKRHGDRLIYEEAKAGRWHAIL